MQCLIFIECVEFSRDDNYVLLITVTAQWAWWRLKSPASRLFTQPFVQVQTKENIKAPCHWPLWGEFPGQRASNTENVPIWWRPLSSSKYKRSTALLLIRNNIISYAIKSGTAQVTLYRSVLPMFTMFPIFHDHDRTIRSWSFAPDLWHHTLPTTTNTTEVRLLHEWITTLDMISASINDLNKSSIILQIGSPHDPLIIFSDN